MPPRATRRTPDIIRKERNWKPLTICTNSARDPLWAYIRIKRAPTKRPANPRTWPHDLLHPHLPMHTIRVADRLDIPIRIPITHIPRTATLR